jgi:hypothetical protein
VFEKFAEALVLMEILKRVPAAVAEPTAARKVEVAHDELHLAHVDILP